MAAPPQDRVIEKMNPCAPRQPPGTSTRRIGQAALRCDNLRQAGINKRSVSPFSSVVPAQPAAWLGTSPRQPAPAHPCQPTTLTRPLLASCQARGPALPTAKPGQQSLPKASTAPSDGQAEPPVPCQLPQLFPARLNNQLVPIEHVCATSTTLPASSGTSSPDSPHCPAAYPRGLVPSIHHFWSGRSIE